MEDYKEIALTNKSSLEQKLGALDLEFDTKRAQFEITREEYHKYHEMQQKLQEDIRYWELESLPREKKFFIEILWSDRLAYEVVNECTRNKYEIRRLATKSDGKGGYFYQSDLNGAVIPVRRHKDGYFWFGTMKFVLTDEPTEYYDPSF